MSSETAQQLAISGITGTTKGIFQSDVILRSALDAALKDIRAQPWLLDWVFAGLPKDTLTKKDYGDAETERAKKWFLDTNIKVFLVPNTEEASWPCLTISLLDSSLAPSEVTLGDVHYDPAEEVGSTWPTLASVRVAQYEQETGIMDLQSAPPGYALAPGMFITDYRGQGHEILEVFSTTSLKIEPGTQADFRGSLLKGRRNTFVAHVESAMFRETYRIGVHAASEATYLTWLHSIVVFALLRYKQPLLEARGIERTTFSSSDFAQDQGHEVERTFSRYVTITGYVRHFWPKVVAQKIDAMDLIPVPDAANTLWDDNRNPNRAMWIGPEDEEDFERE